MTTTDPFSTSHDAWLIERAGSMIEVTGQDEIRAWFAARMPGQPAEYEPYAAMLGAAQNMISELVGIIERQTRPGWTDVAAGIDPLAIPANRIGDPDA